MAFWSWKGASRKVRLVAQQKNNVIILIVSIKAHYADASLWTPHFPDSGEQE